MWGSLLELLAKLAGIAATTFGRKNAPDMVANEAARRQQEMTDKANKAVQDAMKTGNLNQIRKDAA